MSKLKTWPDFRSVSGDTLTKSVMVTGLLQKWRQCDTKLCLRFSVCTEAKWVSVWWDDLMDEGLQGFGLAESAKTMDSRSSWSFEGTSIFFVVCFLIFCVVCKWWALFCILHGMGGTWHCSTWSVVLSLDEMPNGRLWVAIIRQSFQSGEVKFFDS
jgi:hypothetical protein